VTVSAQAFCTGQSGLHTIQSGGLPPWCHLKLFVRATVPGAPDSPACGTGQSDVPPDSPVILSGQSDYGNTSSFLGLYLIFIMSSFEVLLFSIPWSK
jgi:hypothetical protein